MKVAFTLYFLIVFVSFASCDISALFGPDIQKKIDGNFFFILSIFLYYKFF